MPFFDVNVHAVVLVKVVNVEAESMKEAIIKAENDQNIYDAIGKDLCFCQQGKDPKPYAHIEFIQYADEVVDFLVDVVGDTEYAQTRRFAADGVTVVEPGQ